MDENDYSKPSKLTQEKPGSTLPSRWLMLLFTLIYSFYNSLGWVGYPLNYFFPPHVSRARLCSNIFQIANLALSKATFVIFNLYISMFINTNISQQQNNKRKLSSNKVLIS